MPRDLKVETDRLATIIGTRLNDGAPVPLHKVGYVLCVFDFGPNQQAHYSSNCDRRHTAEILEKIVQELRTFGDMRNNHTIIVP